LESEPPFCLTGDSTKCGRKELYGDVSSPMIGVRTTVAGLRNIRFCDMLNMAGSQNLSRTGIGDSYCDQEPMAPTEATTMCGHALSMR
jgi:hypothetical protein